MAVFRFEKTKDYTVMAKFHLRYTTFSLKAKGLLSLMKAMREEIKAVEKLRKAAEKLAEEQPEQSRTKEGYEL